MIEVQIIANLFCNAFILIGEFKFQVQLVIKFLFRSKYCNGE